MNANVFTVNHNLASTQQTRQNNILLLWLTCLFVASMFAFAWIGYLDSDDSLYSAGAIKWLEGPNVGESYFELRHPVVLAIAASYALFGVGIMQLALVSTFFSAATLILVYFGLKRFGTQTACLGIALLASLPLFALNATITFCDTVEMFFVCLSFFLFIKAIDSDQPVKWMVLAGMVAALGYMSRATTVGLIAGYGLLFLFGQGPKRTHYWWMAGGFVVVAGIEALIMYLSTGDPFYRLTLGWDNVTDDNRTLAGAAAGLPDMAGNIRLAPILDPFLVFFVNHEFSIMFMLAIPAAIWATIFRPRDREGHKLIQWLVVIGIMWAITMTIVLGKFSHPRYFLVTCVCFAFPLVVWLKEVVFEKSRYLAAVLVLMLIGANITGIYLDNKNPMSGEKLLRDYLLTTNESIYTDPYTAFRAKFILSLSGLEDRLLQGEPAKGSLYFYNPGRLETYRGEKIDAEPYLPKESWERIHRTVPDRKLSGIVLEKLGLSDYIPHAYLRRLDNPWLPVEVYRVKD